MATITISVEGATPEQAARIVEALNGAPAPAPASQAEAAPAPAPQAEAAPAPAPQAEAAPAPATQAEAAPAPAPRAEAAPAPAPRAEAAPAGDLDSSGTPWDERINTSNRGKRADGTWKRKPGLTDEQYNAVLAELKPASAPAPAPAPQAEAAPAPATDGPASTFAELTRKIIANRTPPATVSEGLASIGLQNMRELMASPDMVPLVDAALFGG